MLTWRVSETDVRVSGLRADILVSGLGTNIRVSGLWAIFRVYGLGTNGRVSELGIYARVSGLRADVLVSELGTRSGYLDLEPGPGILIATSSALHGL